MACPRRGHLEVKHLGPAGSTINWFACPACRLVWFDRPATPDVDVAPPRGTGRKHILVVDDDPKVSRIVARWLSDYRVSIARDGDEALAIIRSERVDLLIVDYVMPSMTGQELVEMCTAEGRIFSVLLLTGYVDILEREDASWWASWPRLTKPVDVDELRAAVARLIGGASSPHTPHQ